MFFINPFQSGSCLVFLLSNLLKKYIISKSGVSIFKNKCRNIPTESSMEGGREKRKPLPANISRDFGKTPLDISWFGSFVNCQVIKMEASITNRLPDWFSNKACSMQWQKL